MPRYVLLDRDGTLVADDGYAAGVSSPLTVLPGVVDGLRTLVDAGYLLAIVTNQSAIGRGLMTQTQLDAVHAEMRQQLGVPVDIFSCPHTPENRCDCRKPLTGLVRHLQAELSADSWMIGDKASDVYFAHNLGIGAVLLRSPYWRVRPPRVRIVDDFTAATAYILSAAVCEKGER